MCNSSKVVVFGYLLVFGNLCRAAEILDYLPRDTLSFALIRDVQVTNDKIVKLVGIFKEGLPDPLTMAQAMTGLSAGLDLQGDMLFALLPAGGAAALPAPMFLLPVMDYTVFAKSIKADATGEICRVSIADEDVLVAKIDDLALVMNIEHREIMQRVLAKDRENLSEITGHQDWLGKNDISMMVTQAGIAYAAEAAKQQTQPATTVGAAEGAPQPAVANDMLGLSEALPFAEFFKRAVKTAGLGLAIDDSTNARTQWVVDFQESDADLSVTRRDGAKLFVGFADKPYAFAGGGSLPEDFDELLPELFTDLSKELTRQGGGGGYTEQDWSDVRKTYDLAFSRVQAASLLLTPAAEREPLLSVLFARLTVDDSQAYLGAMKECFELSNKIADRTNSDINLNYAINETTITGAKGIEVSSDLGKATGDGNNHVWQALLTSVLGMDHKLSIYLCATDEHQVFVGMESSEKLAQFIEAYRKGDTGLAENSHVKRTLGLMDSGAAWVNLFNPEGFVELVRAAMKSMMILGGFPEFPAYPSAPPLGVTLTGDDNSWHGEIVLPVEAARAMATFTKEVDKTFGQ